MGAVMKVSMLNADILQTTTTPIILCSFPNRIAKLIDGGPYAPLDLNVAMAGALLGFPQSQRSQKAHDEVMKIVRQRHTPTFLEHYEILFDPRYGIDAIKVFTELSRYQRAVIKWCGTLNGSALEYATPEYRDFHSFRIHDYNITCFI